jgi:hypothetical protein
VAEAFASETLANRELLPRVPMEGLGLVGLSQSSRDAC